MSPEMSRRCSHCTSTIVPVSMEGSIVREFADHVASTYAAWLAGYCTTMCQRNAALTTVALGNAWWQS